MTNDSDTWAQDLDSDLHYEDSTLLRGCGLLELKRWGITTELGSKIGEPTTRLQIPNKNQMHLLEEHSS